jgi:ribosome maturation factor RimP
MKQTPLEDKIAALTAPVLSGMGYALVQARVTGDDGQTVRILAENADGRLDIADCAKISRALSALFDVEDPIPGAYRLEVSSPGIDRPLVRARDFTTYAGKDVKIELDIPLNGQKKFRGLLRGEEGGHVLLDTDNGPVRLPLDDIAKAKLVMGEALLGPPPGKKKVLNRKNGRRKDKTAPGAHTPPPTDKRHEA